MKQLCTDHQEEVDNNKDQCLKCMEIQYRNEIIKVEEAIKEQQQVMNNHKLDKQDNIKTIETMKQQKIKLTQEFDERLIKFSSQSQKFRKLNYKLLKEYPNNYYWSFAFNQDSNLLFAGGGKDIKLFKFKNGIKLLQTITKHTEFVQSLIFMNKSNLFISGSWDKSIIIWNQDYNSNWKPYQQLVDHQDDINIMINNEDEDLLISGSSDKTIKLWSKTNMNWSCQQTIQTKFKVQSLSLSKSQTKLISCGYAKEIKVIELNPEQQQWSVTQTIRVNCYGLQLCFLSNSKFLFQGYQECLEIYEYQQNERQFIKEQTIEIQKVVSYSNQSYPCKYLESKGFALIQYGNYLNFFGSEKQNCELFYSIDFKQNYFRGNISNDGQFLVACDYTLRMQVRKLNELK